MFMWLCISIAGTNTAWNSLFGLAYLLFSNDNSAMNCKVCKVYLKVLSRDGTSEIYMDGSIKILLDFLN